MTADQQPEPDPNERPLPEPEPVSKHNLWVLIGCTVLVIALVLLGPWLYPALQRLNPFIPDEPAPPTTSTQVESAPAAAPVELDSPEPQLTASTLGELSLSSHMPVIVSGSLV